MTAPHFTVLTQKEITIDLSRPAMQTVLACIRWLPDLPIHVVSESVQCEVDNFRNMLQNLLDRSEPYEPPSPMTGEAAAIYDDPEPGNFDLIGE